MAGDSLVNSGRISATRNESSYAPRVDNAVYTEGMNTHITNLAGGEIVALADNTAGVRFGTTAGGSMLFNAGSIVSAHDFGVSLSTVNSGAAVITVTNAGTIHGEDGAYPGSVNADVLVNRGLLVGDVLMGDGADRLDARGSGIEGTIDLGAGNDSYDGRGAFVQGAVYGGNGADTFIGNAGLADIFDGGSDSSRDTLDFRGQGAALVALDQNFGNGGSAAGDTYTGFENIYGSNQGGDVLRGNGSANTLFGFGTDDQIAGAGGDDVIRGGTGTDTLSGGNGNDIFRFAALNEVGDQITDFTNASGTNDRLDISASALGGGLVAGALAASAFISRADNVAQDADDRFIFRTTDNTVWFDDDGNGTHAAVLVADLQAGATFTAADIVLI